MAASPTSRSLEELRKHGYRAQVVERYNPHARRRVDLYGWIDIVALDGKPGVLGVQATSASNLSSRVQKICGECAEAAEEWLRAGNRAEVWAWSKKGPAGKRKVWVLRRHVIELPELLWRKALQ